MIFTIIGNCEVAEPERLKYVPIVKALLKAGHEGRSGGAKGMDYVLTQAIEELMQEGVSGFKACVYIPHRLFNDLQWGKLGHRVHYVKWFKNYSRAMGIAAECHPVWHHCDDYTRHMHARNVYEILGTDLNTPSDFVICHARTNRNGVVMGGTATAIKLANDRSIPIFNGYTTSFEQLHEFLKERGIENVELDHGE